MRRERSPRRSVSIMRWERSPCRSAASLRRCPWAKGADYEHYHDHEWGVPCYDRNKLFEKLCLEGQQAGLSWITVLRKREHYRHFFHQFVPERIAQMHDSDLNALLKQPELIRHTKKLYSIRTNALALLALEAQGVNFVEFIWNFIGGQPHINHWTSTNDIPTQTEASQALSKALKKAGFSFIGPTTCYAFMQSMGLINDHLTTCPQHPNHT